MKTRIIFPQQIVSFFSFFFFKTRVYRKGWPETHYIPQDGLTLMVTVPQPPEC